MGWKERKRSTPIQGYMKAVLRALLSEELYIGKEAEADVRGPPEVKWALKLSENMQFVRVSV